MESVLTESRGSNIPVDSSDRDDKQERKESNSSDTGDVTSDEQIKFNRLVTKAKQLAAEGQIQMALELNKRALKICHHEKLQKRIAKMESKQQEKVMLPTAWKEAIYVPAYLKEYEEEEEEDHGMIHVGKGFYLFKDLYAKLYSHQQEGVLWMWGLHKKKKGGILGDDMGLGKTIQVIAFLTGLFDMDKVHSVIIVMPVSVMVNWENEFKKWAPGITLTCFHGTSKREKERALRKVQRRGGVCLTSYGMVVTSWEQLSQKDEREFVWDYMILDEGHKIKNPTKTTKGVHAVGAHNRLILTGTPIQNNLRELWSLFDFVHKGALLGTARTFKMEYENPITRSRERDATNGERKLGQEMAESLKKIIAPYFLRRTKASVTNKEDKENENPDDDDNKESNTKMPSFTRKNDFIIWLFLTQTQQMIYHDFISLDSVKELLMTKKSPLVALTVLKKISDHPRLLSKRACAQLGLDGQDRMDDTHLMESEDGLTCAANQIQDIDDDVLINESGKLIFVVQLLDQLKKEGHRALLFSQSRKMLDIIEKVTTNRGHKVMRLDGTVTHMADRDRIIKKFQTDNTFSLFLLTTQVGGVGLTLTAADRVIIYDPSWNPATDAQAVDRVFRIGQNKNVVIYRLITCGTVEEKIYRRQIFKDSITRQTTGNAKNPYRYFTKQELRELFSLDNPRCSTTQQQLEEMHSGSRISDPSLDAHIAFLYSLDMFGLTDHDLMFNHESGKMDDRFEGGEEEQPVESNHLAGNDYIQHRVQKAQELIRMESELGGTFQERISKYPRNIDAQDNGPTQKKREPKSFTFGPNSGHPYIPPEDDHQQIQKKHDLSEECIDLTTVENSSDQNSSGDYEDAIDLTEDEEMEEVKHKIEEMSFHESPQKPQVVRSTYELSSSQEKQTDGILENIKTEEQNLSIKQELKCHEDVKGQGQLFRKGSESPTSTDEVSPLKQDGGKSDDHLLPVKHEPQSPSLESSPELDTEERDMSFDNEIDLSGSDKKPIESKHIVETPEKMELGTPKGSGMKNRRKSVSQSPWLSRTPNSGKKCAVIEERIFISPDISRPIVKTEPTISSLIGTESSPSGPKVRLNSTIFSAFSDSPDMNEKSLSGSSANESPMSSPKQANNLYTTFVGDSPESKPLKSNLYKTFVGNSPNNADVSLTYAPSENSEEEDVYVVDSVQNTPSVNNICSGPPENLQETDDDNSPVKISHTPVLENGKGNVSMRTPLHDVSMDSPIATSKVKRKCKRAVIQSSDDEDSETDYKAVNSKSDLLRKESVIISSEDDLSDSDMECEQNSSVSSKGDNPVDISNGSGAERKSVQSDFISSKVDCDDDSVDEDESEEDTDMSGFIVNDSEEEDSYSDDSEEADESMNAGEQDFESLPEHRRSAYKELVKSSKSLLKSGSYEEALANILQALEIFPEPSSQALALTIHKQMEA